MNFILFDEVKTRQSLLPLTFTRPIAALRVGIHTLAEKWLSLGATQISYLPEAYLASKFPAKVEAVNYLVHGGLIANEEIYQAIIALKLGEALYENEALIALCISEAEMPSFSSLSVVLATFTSKFTNNQREPQTFSAYRFKGKATFLKQLWHIFENNGAEIRADFARIKTPSAVLEDIHTKVYAPENIWIGEGVKIRAAVLNAEDGPIYIGKGVQIQEGAVIRGPFAIGENSVVQMGAKIRPDTTIGPFCKVGGEVSNAVFIGYSNKAHDGFLGNSVIGEWCNLGADTNTSNLKNNYTQIKIWSYAAHDYIDTGKQFCGMFMGDHSKTSINSMINTGTVVGVNVNIFGANFPAKFLPSFSWGGSEGLELFDFTKAMEIAEKVMARRNIPLGQIDLDILRSIFEQQKIKLGA